MQATARKLNEIQVFSEEWFHYHQTKLLFFANNRLTSTKFRDAVGIDFDEEVIYISPYAIGRVLDRKAGVNQLRTHCYPYYGDSFRNNLINFWGFLHWCDSVFLDKAFKNFNFGFYTFRLLPPLTAPYIIKQVVKSAAGLNWAAVTTGTGTSIFNSLNFYRVSATAVTNEWTDCYHSFFHFNTSGTAVLGVDTVISGRISLFCSSKSNTLGASPVASIYESLAVSNGATSDYNLRGTTKLTTDLAYVDTVANFRHYFELNASGIANVKLDGNPSRFFLIDSAYDAAGSAPPWVSGGNINTPLVVAPGARSITDMPTLEVEFISNSMGHANNPVLRPAVFSPGLAR